MLSELQGAMLCASNDCRHGACEGACILVAEYVGLCQHHMRSAGRGTFRLGTNSFEASKSEMENGWQGRQQESRIRKHDEYFGVFASMPFAVGDTSTVAWGWSLQ